MGTFFWIQAFLAGPIGVPLAIVMVVVWIKKITMHLRMARAARQGIVPDCTERYIGMRRAVGRRGVEGVPYANAHWYCRFF